MPLRSMPKAARPASCWTTRAPRWPAPLGVIAPMVVFTSGGSEANTMAMSGASVRRLLVSAIEHPSVLAAASASGKSVETGPGDG